MATLAISGMTTLTGSGNNNNCVFPILDLETSLTANQNEKLKISSHNQFFSNNTSVGNLSSYNNYFGTGVDGDATISSSTQISSSTSPTGLNNIIYGDIIVKNFKNLTINNGVLYTPLRACRGLLIYCTGDLTVNGTLSMTGKGGGVGYKIATPIGVARTTDARFDLVDASIYVNNISSSLNTVGGRGIPTHWNWAPSGSVWFTNYKIRIPLSGSVAGGTPSGGAGGLGGSGVAGVNCCGGGGAGGNGQAIYGGYQLGAAGGRGTVFAGGGGGGGGGGGYAGSNGGSATLEVPGNAGTSVYHGQGGAGGNGAGGNIVIVVRGNVSVNGTISCNGVIGVSTPGGGGSGGAGGGTGGGCLTILYGGTYTNAGSVVANGGPAGTPNGGSGGAGVIRIKKIHI